MYFYKIIFIKPNVNKVIIYLSVIAMFKVLLNLPLCINTFKSQYVNIHFWKKNNAKTAPKITLFETF